MAIKIAPAPAMPVLRSPVLPTMNPAIGAINENVNGLAITNQPMCEGL